MATRFSDQQTDIDAKAGRAVARGVGEKLRQVFAEQSTQFPPRLQLLLDRLRAEESKSSTDR